MNLEEAINSDDVEIAELAANLLLKKVTSKKIKSILKKYGRYNYDYIDGHFYLKKKLKEYQPFDMFNQWKMTNTPLLSTAELKNNVIYTNGDDGTITFDVPYKIDEK